ncbi:protein kinase [Perkinsela sp. CCAP 1560/4]|nr:protein kinase [Perkinsela sp. CCAP 1560/4]|eukprot:KNH07863.1 protein kinase [Perkinsela sp. CCAP 1560/4]
MSPRSSLLACWIIFEYLLIVSTEDMENPISSTGMTIPEQEDFVENMSDHTQSSVIVTPAPTIHRPGITKALRLQSKRNIKKLPEFHESLPIVHLLGNRTNLFVRSEAFPQYSSFEKLLGTCLTLERILSTLEDSEKDWSHSSAILPHWAYHRKPALQLQGILDSYCSRRDMINLNEPYPYYTDHHGTSLMVRDEFLYHTILIIGVNFAMLLLFFLVAFLYLVLKARALGESTVSDLSILRKKLMFRSHSKMDNESLSFTLDLKKGVYRNIQSLSGSPVSHHDRLSVRSEDYMTNIHRNTLSHAFYFTHFIHKRIIGKGGCGAVFLAEHRTTGINYAVKIVAIPPSMTSRIRAEASMHALLDHVNVVRYFSSWEDRLTDLELKKLGLIRVSQSSCTSTGELTDGKSADNELRVPSAMSSTNTNFLFIQMCYYEHGTLRDWLVRPQRNVDLRENLIIFEQITAGLLYLHSQGILHRDLKPGNIFISYTSKTRRTEISSHNAQSEFQKETSMCVKIGDFGLSIVQNTSSLGESSNSEDWKGFSDRTAGVGTPAYCSPEQLTHGRVSEASDVFALGIIMLECFIDVHTESEKHAIFTAARRGTVNEARYDVAVRYPIVTQLITEMVAQNPLERLSLSGVKSRVDELLTKHF